MSNSVVYFSLKTIHFILFQIILWLKSPLFHLLYLFFYFVNHVNHIVKLLLSIKCLIFKYLIMIFHVPTNFLLYYVLKKLKRLLISHTFLQLVYCFFQVEWQINTLIQSDCEVISLLTVQIPQFAKSPRLQFFKIYNWHDNFCVFFSTFENQVEFLSFDFQSSALTPSEFGKCISGEIGSTGFLWPFISFSHQECDILVICLPTYLLAYLSTYYLFIIYHFSPVRPPKVYLVCMLYEIALLSVTLYLSLHNFCPLHKINKCPEEHRETERENHTLFIFLWIISLSMCLQVLSMLLQMEGYHSFSWLNNLPLFVIYHIFLSVHPVAGTYFVLVSWLLWMML